MDQLPTSNAPQPEAADAAPQRWQFSLWQLMLVVASVCTVGGLYHWLGLFILLPLGGLLIVWLVIMALRFGRPGEIVVAMLIMLCLAGLLLPQPGSRPAGKRASCQNNLKQIIIALQNYHDAYGSFPPAYVADASGRPMHSWRVLILPFIEQKPLYDLYRFDEPWDGPHNSKLAGTILKVYQCPADATKGSCDTSYVAVVGPETAWPGERSIKLGDIKDGAGNTILIVEVHHSGIHWMEPRDLHTLQVPLAINPPRGQGISSAHVHCAQAARADGSVFSLPDETPPETLRAMLTIAGGD